MTPVCNTGFTSQAGTPASGLPCVLNRARAHPSALGTCLGCSPVSDSQLSARFLQGCSQTPACVWSSLAVHDGLSLSLPVAIHLEDGSVTVLPGVSLPVCSCGWTGVRHPPTVACLGSTCHRLGDPCGGWAVPAELPHCGLPACFSGFLPSDRCFEALCRTWVRAHPHV